MARSQIGDMGHRPGAGVVGVAGHDHRRERRHGGALVAEGAQEVGRHVAALRMPPARCIAAVAQHDGAHAPAVGVVEPRAVRLGAGPHPAQRGRGQVLAGARARQPQQLAFDEGHGRHRQVEAQADLHRRVVTALAAQVGRGIRLLQTPGPAQRARRRHTGQVMDQIAIGRGRFHAQGVAPVHVLGRVARDGRLLRGQRHHAPADAQAAGCVDQRRQRPLAGTRHGQAQQPRRPQAAPRRQRAFRRAARQPRRQA
ncbi:MAG: hypothetical protein IPI51_07890 [Betaproteobacteria bacterium]|nr:hypothetical protein [Betaproteobacteria bacterium]